jgi:uncharacterized protein (TIGR02266 family)
MGSAGDGDSKGPTRLQSRVPVQLRIVFQDVGEVLEAFSTNLGAGGMLLISNREVAEGSRLRLRFKLPGIADEFHTWAEVAWRRTDKTGFGLRFIDLDDANQQRIARFVTERWSELARSAVVASAAPTVHGGLAGPLSQRGLRTLSARDVLGTEKLLDDLCGVGVIMLDLLLPPLDGLHVLRAMRARPALLARQVPVIILVEGALSPADMDRMRGEGATAVLSYGRPSDWVKLADAALSLIGKPVAIAL